jgi:2-keto-4-pentenoate hydratase/2-oxohepta-3-ene-1,7-dioic acid hydratase in catechol pathway
MSPATRSSSTAACATTRNSRLRRARTGRAPARSAPGSVTADEIPDPGKLTLTTRLNGQQVQHSATDKLIYSCQQIVSFCSDFTELHPGDVIATGTPEGVGHSRKPPLWMKPGDVLEVEISGVGVLRTRIVDEA